MANPGIASLLQLRRPAGRVAELGRFAGLAEYPWIRMLIAQGPVLGARRWRYLWPPSSGFRSAYSCMRRQFPSDWFCSVGLWHSPAHLSCRASFCLRATHRYLLIGFAYAAGVAAATVGAALVAPRSDTDRSWLIFQFAIVFVVVGLTSLIATGLCTLLKREVQRARAKEKPSE